MRAFAILVLLLTTACGRQLTPGETAFAATLFGPELQTRNIRIAPFPALTSITQRRPPRPRKACRELIWPTPEITGGTVETFTAAFVTFNRLNMARQLYAPDYLPEYPKKMSLPAAMLIGHELTHVWQWQNRDRTKYHPLKAAAEHAPGTDPYLLEIGTKNDFLALPFEQQGAIVEEYICCSSLDPGGARTKRLHALLRGAMPVTTVSNLPKTDVILPWNGARTAGICS